MSIGSSDLVVVVEQAGGYVDDDQLVGHESVGDVERGGSERNEEHEEHGHDEKIAVPLKVR